MPKPTVFVNSTSEKTLTKDLEKLLLKSTGSLSWLKPGDLVLLKPALNSGDPYPATTHPLAVQILEKVLKKRGAKVLIADQSGIEHVLHSPQGVIRGSSRKLFLRSGMGTSKLDFIGFEETDWEQDFFHFNSSKLSAWENGFFVSKTVQKADHIINLPRLSTHVCAGTSLGLKNLVGLLRQDSRLELHAAGPFTKYINSFTQGSNLNTSYPAEKDFLEKIAELALATQNKLRLTLYIGTEAQTVFGPDKKVARFFKTVTPDFNEKVLFASNDIVAAEVFAYAFLKYLYQQKTPILAKKLEAFAFFQSRKNHLTRFTPRENPAIKHAQKIGLGRTNFTVDWGNLSKKLQNKLQLFR